MEREVHEPHEILIVYDFPEDSTLPAVAAMQPPCTAVRLVHNTLGRGVLNALKAGFQASRGDVVVVMMADRSDEPRDVAALTRLVRDGADVAAGSRYMRGGRQEGGPWLKRTLSRLAGVSLHYFAGLPDPRRHQQFPRLQPPRRRTDPDRGGGEFRPGAGADAQGPLARLARGRGADHLARPHGGAVALPPVGVDAALPALVLAGAASGRGWAAGVTVPLAPHLPNLTEEGAADSGGGTAPAAPPSLEEATMRSLFLSLALLAAAGLAALTPGEASAFGRRWAYYDGYYGGYYAPTYSYYGADRYYTTSSYGGYTATPYVSSYYAPELQRLPGRARSLLRTSLSDYYAHRLRPAAISSYAPTGSRIYP